MIQDVTAQVQAEEQVRMLERAVEQSSDGIAVADMEEKIQFVNPAWAAMHGYDNPESLKGQLIPIFHTEEEFQVSSNRSINAS
jgi:PAS domain S-box-containing protein